MKHVKVLRYDAFLADTDGQIALGGDTPCPRCFSEVALSEQQRHDTIATHRFDYGKER